MLRCCRHANRPLLVKFLNLCTADSCLLLHRESTTVFMPVPKYYLTLNRAVVHNCLGTTDVEDELNKLKFCNIIVVNKGVFKLSFLNTQFSSRILAIT